MVGQQFSQPRPQGSLDQKDRGLWELRLQFAKDHGANYQGSQFPEGRGVCTQATDSTSGYNTRLRAYDGRKKIFWNQFSKSLVSFAEFALFQSQYRRGKHINVLNDNLGTLDRTI